MSQRPAHSCISIFKAMNASWKFLGGVIAGVLLLLGVNVAALYAVLGVPTVNSRWAFEIYQKKQEIAAQAASPRLLVCGGSSALFGIKAQELEKKAGMRTINLGTHAGLGLACILRQARAVARPGDTLLLVLEYDLYDSGKLGVDRVGQEEIDYVLSHEPAVVRNLSLPQLYKVVMATPVKRLKIGIKNRFDPSRYNDGVETGLAGATK